MNDSTRVGESADIARTILDSARADVPTPEGRRKAAMMMGLSLGGGGAGGGGGVAGAGASAARAGINHVGAGATGYVTATSQAPVIFKGLAIAIVALGVGGIAVKSLSLATQPPTQQVAHVPSVEPPRVQPQPVAVAAEPPMPAARPSESWMTERNEANPQAVVKVPTKPIREPVAVPAKPLRKIETVQASGDSSLREEILVLDRARASLQRNDGPDTLRILEEYDQRFGASAIMAPESEVLRIQSHVVTGSYITANRLAQAFLTRHAGNPLAAQVHSLIEGLPK